MFTVRGEAIFTSTFVALPVAGADITMVVASGIAKIVAPAGIPVPFTAEPTVKPDVSPTQTDEDPRTVVENRDVAPALNPELPP
jgi:hypothetical protein